MGAIVEFHCPACVFSTGRLSIGWGKAGRSQFWGGLARCEPCKEVGVVDLSTPEPNSRGRRCVHCGGQLLLVEGTQTGVPCPLCGVPMDQQRLGAWA